VKDRTPKRSGRYVVLDRDGTLNVEKRYLCDPADLELIPGVAEGLTLLQNHGFGLVVISNQSGIGRGKQMRSRYSCSRDTEGNSQRKKEQISWQKT
jgi:HAD superfamily hydrolase (TIGR01662 family)